MIREIKFKAKQLNTGKWFKGDLVHIGKRVCIGGDHLKDGITDVDPSTICQYTGLKDDEGNELWEHDMVMTTTRHLVFAKAEVVWSDKDAKFCLKAGNKMYDNISDAIRLHSKFDKEENI